MPSKIECKVVLVGDGKVGKTALINRLTKDTFMEVREAKKNIELGPVCDIAFKSTPCGSKSFHTKNAMFLTKIRGEGGIV